MALIYRFYLSTDMSLMMIEKGIVEELSRFGIDEIEAKVFLHLLRIGPARAGSVTSALHYDRNTVYRALVRLKNKGLIVSTFANPPLYLAADPQEAISTILFRMEESFILAKKAGYETIEHLQNMQHARNSTSDDLDLFTVIQGKHNIYSKTTRIIQNAEKPIFIVTTEEEIARIYHTMIPEVVKQMSEKLDIRILFPKLIRIEDLLESFGDANMRHSAAIPTEGIIVLEEGKQLLMSGSMLNSDASGLYTNNSNIILNIQHLCKKLWKGAKSVELRADK